MNVLIVAATEMEIAPLLAHFDHFTDSDGAGLEVRGNQIETYITGVGAPATTYRLTKWLNTLIRSRRFEAGANSISTAWDAEIRHKYDFILQAGVGGSYTTDIGLGDVVFVDNDQFGDIGAEDHEDYRDIFEIGLLREDQFPYSGKKLIAPPHPILKKLLLPQVSGLTVNTVSGHERTIRLRKEKYRCEVESMEGAAFHFVCLQEQVPFAQVRAISNYVIPRDKSQWRMKDAIVNLNKWLIDFVDAL